MTLGAFPGAALREGAAPLSGRLPVGLLAAALPVPLSIGLGVAYGHLAGVDEAGAVGINLAYGAASLAVLAGVYYALSGAERRAAFRFERPSRSELGLVAVPVPLGSAAFLAGEAAAGAAGFELGGYEYGLGDPVVVAAVVFGAVVVAPLAEEVLFRGLLLGGLLARGLPPALAGGAAIAAFGLLHFPLLGVAGVVATAVWSVFPTAVRLRYDNLTGAWLLHAVNNVWAYLGVVAFGLA